MTSPHPALRYRDYSVSFGSRQVTRDVSFDLVPGSILALVGESGSGKSVTALAPLGLVPGASESGSVLLCAEEGTAAPAGPAPASAGP
ncbi:ABC transporter ATP-binding protein, partial [Burkholderia multivorans]